MTTRGRPRRVSRAMLAEAASELFLEQGYHQTSADDIATRAGVSRATFFNYFPSKADILFSDIDTVLDAIDARIATGEQPLSALLDIATSLGHADLPLIASQSEVMDAALDLAAVGPARFERLRTTLAAQFPDSLDHWIIAAAISSAALTWATDANQASTLRSTIEHALKRISPCTTQATSLMH